jgi:acetaldehyde dehydrogenase (acetylating)
VLVDTDLQSVQEVRNLCRQAKEAQERFADFSQAEVDRVVAAMAEAGFRAAERLARKAVEETGYGRVEDKIKKNQFCTRDLYESIRDLRTVGVIREDSRKRLVEIAEPVGVVAAIIPTTNPTSTTFFKGIIAVKTRNAVIFSPHPRAVGCICESAQVLREAAEASGAPAGLIGCMSRATLSGTNELMHHRDVGLILATGGYGLVKAAYSSGKPAYGVGPGNVPVYIDRSADVPKAVADAVAGKTFDYGTLCSSEQALVVDVPVKDEVISQLREHRAYFLSAAEADRVGKVLITPDGRVNPDLVGQPASRIAQAAGFEVPTETSVLVAELGGVGSKFPLSGEKLSPVFAFYTVNGWEEGLLRCIEIVNFGGRGHTAAVHARDRAVVHEFAQRIPASRIVVNTPASLGAVGYTNELDPSMTLGCGSHGGNITADNITARHLMNIKRVAWETRPLADRSRRRDWRPVVRRDPEANREAPYHKALATSVSRKGAAGMQRPAETPASSQPPSQPPSERRYGSSGLTESDVERIVQEFQRSRR